MIEVVMIFLNEMSKPLNNEAYFGLALVALGINFPLIILSLIFYQIPEIKRINKKQLLLNAFNIFFMIVFCMFLYFNVSGIYWENIVAFFVSIISLVFLYLKIFKKQNNAFYSLLNLWWILFWLLWLSSAKYLYGIVLVYLIVFSYKQLWVLIVSLLLILGLYLLRFYNLYIFDQIVFCFLIFFPFVLVIFLFIKVLLWLFRQIREMIINQNNINLKKIDYCSTVGLSLIIVLFVFGIYQANRFYTNLFFSFIVWFFLIPFVVLLIFVIAKMAIYLVKKAK